MALTQLTRVRRPVLDLGYVDVRDYGAKGDGVTDDTQAFLEAVAANSSVYVPVGSYLVKDLVLDAIPYLTLQGEGKIVQGTDTPVLVSNCADLKISGIHFEGRVNAGRSGVLRLRGCSRASVSDCIFSNMGELGGLILETSTNVSITGNTFLNAQVASDRGFTIASDIRVWNTNSKVTIHDNIFSSNGAYAVNVNAQSPGSVVEDVIVTGNHISGYAAYGVMAYRNRQTAAENHVGIGLIVSGNIISDITGANPASPTSSRKTFGAGIYVQGWEKSVVSANKIFNVAQQTTDDLLAAAGVGVANCGSFVIDGNLVDTSGFYGIKVNDSVDLGDATASAAITNNVIRNTVRDGIQVVQRDNINVSGNSVTSSRRHGIILQGNPSDPAVRSRKLVVGNMVSDIAQDGITIAYQNQAEVSGNLINGCAQGIVADSSSFFLIKDNMLKSVTGISIRVNSTCSGGAAANLVSTNMAQDSGTGRLFVAAEASQINNVGMTPEGAYGDMRRITAPATSLSVSGVNLLTLAFNTLSDLNTLSGGYVGQRITFFIEAGRTNFVHGTNLMLAGSVNYTPPANACISFLCISSGRWIETGRVAP